MDMKRNIIILIFLAFLSLISYSQKNENIKLYQFKLDNGLTVYLNEDHSIPNVLGAVIIKTGGKYDDPNHTGTSHYLEHMMFKGTDEIGTVDYEKEKVLLEEIRTQYDILAKTTDDQERKNIQKNINKLSLEAGKYAIPNELDRLLDQIGSSMVNAFTSEEIVAYFNVFPSNQLEKWLILYSHRFKNPVFRLFQSELETVFEEKNMYSDDFFTNLIENFYSKLYKNHPYGTQTVIGKAEHIKNPSLTNMQKMFETYYVANNMALVLTGSFDTNQAADLIKLYFSDWKSGDVPKFPEYKEEPFKGVERYVVRMTPVKVGLLAYRTVPKNHRDEVAIEVFCNLIYNSASTGRLNKLSANGKVLETMCFNDIRNDHGALMVVFIPKIVGQSLKNAEKLVVNEIKKVYTEDIDPKFLESIKLSMIKEFEQSLESPTQRAFLIGQMFVTGKDWDEIMNYPNEIAAITIEDIKRIGNKYFGDNYLSLHSKMGFPKKDKLEKPGFDPIIPENAEAKSKFAEKFENIPDKDIMPEFINFQKDFSYNILNNGIEFYHVYNKVNDLFELTLKFKSGNLDNSKAEQLAQYLMLVGTENLSYNEFNQKLQSYACSFSIDAGDNYFVVKISGFDKYFNESVDLILNLLYKPEKDKSKIKKLVQTSAFTRKYEKKSPDDLSSALFEYGVYGENSQYLRRTTHKEISKLKPDDLIQVLNNIINSGVSVHYSGTLNEKNIAEYLNTKIITNNSKKGKEFPEILPRKEYSENTVLILDDPKSLQSRINFYVTGNINDERERAIAGAYNHYFGTGMSAIVFQEIREFRSMAYSAYAVYRNGENFKTKGYLQAFVGTQCDKTIDAISTMDSLINNMPLKENRLTDIQRSLIQSVNSGKPEFRQLTQSVERWKNQGYNYDPREVEFKVYKKLNFDQILEFYKNNVQKRPMLITIVGNKKDIDLQKLSKFGKVVYVEKKQIVN
jgi:predicted Zn-dependent peptidase